ncbi:hypothetical protein AX17_005041 [Amanita inopinata Kibby_2008]|nr:hypothetical protein AX17_005041 [Amanita inopinata Kibby_2008]
MVVPSPGRNTTGAAGGSHFSAEQREQFVHQPSLSSSSTQHCGPLVISAATSTTSRSLNNVNNDASLQLHSTTPHRLLSYESPASSMIGPMSSCYHHQNYQPNIAVDNDAQRYQQWVDFFTSLQASSELQYGPLLGQNNQHQYPLDHSHYLSSISAAASLGPSPSSALANALHDSAPVGERGVSSRQEPSGNALASFRHEQFASRASPSTFASDTYQQVTPHSGSYLPHPQPAYQQQSATPDLDGQPLHPTQWQDARPHVQPSQIKTIDLMARNDMRFSFSDPKAWPDSVNVNSSVGPTDAQDNRTCLGTGIIRSPQGPDPATNTTNPLVTPTPQSSSRRVSPASPPRGTSSSRKRKRARKDASPTTFSAVNFPVAGSGTDSEGDSEPELAGGISVGMDGLGVVNRTGKGAGGLRP